MLQVIADPYRMADARMLCESSLLSQLSPDSRSVLLDLATSPAPNVTQLCLEVFGAGERPLPAPFNYKEMGPRQFCTERATVVKLGHRLNQSVIQAINVMDPYLNCTCAPTLV